MRTEVFGSRSSNVTSSFVVRSSRPFPIRLLVYSLLCIQSIFPVSDHLRHSISTLFCPAASPDRECSFNVTTGFPTATSYVTPRWTMIFARCRMRSGPPPVAKRTFLRDFLVLITTADVPTGTRLFLALSACKSWKQLTEFLFIASILQYPFAFSAYRNCANFKLSNCIH